MTVPENAPPLSQEFVVSLLEIQTELISARQESIRAAEAKAQLTAAKTEEERIQVEMEAARIAREGDGSADDLECKKQNLKPMTAAYIKCRELIDASRAKFEARAAERRRLEELKLAERREKEDQKRMANMRAEELRQIREKPLTAEEKLIALAREDPKVMELLMRMAKPPPSSSTATSPQPRERPRGDGSADDQKCQDFGWDVGTQGYAGCRQQLYQLRADQEQHRQAMEAYQQRLESYEREADRQRRMRALELGARLLGAVGGTTRLPALGPAPVAPVAPPSSYSIRDIYGRSVNCTAQTTGSMTNINCY